MKFVIRNKNTNKFPFSLILITIALFFITNTTQITVKHKHSQIFYKNKYYDYGDETLLIEKSMINKEKGYIKPNIIIPKYKSISKSIDERDNVPESDYSSSSEINSSSNEFLPTSQQSNTSTSEVGSGQSIVFDDINKELHTYKSASILHNNDIINPNLMKENELSKLNKKIISVTNSNINELISSSDEKNQIKGEHKTTIDLNDSNTHNNGKVDINSSSNNSSSFLKQTSQDITKESQLKQLNIRDSPEALMFNEISQVRKPISEMNKAKSISDNSHPNVYFADNDLEYLISKKVRESKDTREFTKINLKENKNSKETHSNDINIIDAVISNKNNKDVVNVHAQWKQKLEKLLNELKSNLMKNPQDYEFYFKDTQYEFKQVLIANKLLDPASYRISLIGDSNEKKLKELEIKEKLENKYLNADIDLNKEEMTKKIEVIDIKESKNEVKIDENKSYSNSAINNVNTYNTTNTSTTNTKENVNVNVNKLIKEYNLTFNDKTNNAESKLNDMSVDKSIKNLNLNKKKIVKRKIDTINVELKSNQTIKINADKSYKEIKEKNEKDNNKLLLNKEVKESTKNIKSNNHLNDLINKANTDSKALKSGLDNKITTNTVTQEGISTNNKEKELIIKNKQANNAFNNKSVDYKFKFKEAKHKKVDYHKLSSDDVDNKSVLSELLKSLS